MQDRERREEEGAGREDKHDDKGMGGGLDDGVMCCFRANCFCDSETISFIAIGYTQEMIEAQANRAACHGVVPCSVCFTGVDLLKLNKST